MQLQKKKDWHLKDQNRRAGNTIHEANIKTSNNNKNYIGLSANKLKQRIAVHKTTMKSKPTIKYVNSTELPKVIHKLKETNYSYDIERRIR